VLTRIGDCRRILAKEMEQQGIQRPSLGIIILLFMGFTSLQSRLQQRIAGVQRASVAKKKVVWTKIMSIASRLPGPCEEAFVRQSFLSTIYLYLLHA
jgi:hypothetical protein